MLTKFQQNLLGDKEFFSLFILTVVIVARLAILYFFLAVQVAFIAQNKYNISCFISPGKRGTNVFFEVLQFLTAITHVSRYPGTWNRKQQKLCRKNCFDYVVSDL